MFYIYGKSGCSSCEQAKAFLENKGEDYQYLSLGKDFDLGKFMSFNPSHRSFPLISKFVGDTEEYVGTLEDLKMLFV